MVLIFSIIFESEDDCLNQDQKSLAEQWFETGNVDSWTCSYKYGKVSYSQEAGHLELYSVSGVRLSFKAAKMELSSDADDKIV